jgi:hypothetical protein
MSLADQAQGRLAGNPAVVDGEEHHRLGGRHLENTGASFRPGGPATSGDCAGGSGGSVGAVEGEGTVDADAPGTAGRRLADRASWSPLARVSGRRSTVEPGSVAITVAAASATAVARRPPDHGISGPSQRPDHTWSQARRSRSCGSFTSASIGRTTAHLEAPTPAPAWMAEEPARALAPPPAGYLAPRRFRRRRMRWSSSTCS